MHYRCVTANMVDPVQIVGFCAAAASVASFLPQVWKIIKTRNVKGLSVPMYALTAFSFSLWLAFGLLSAQWALILPNALCLAATLFILTMLLLPSTKRSEVADKLDPDVST